MKICKQILKALIYMHEKKVVYRNIRKSNILLFNKEIIPVENNIVKLINFSKAYEIEH